MRKFIRFTADLAWQREHPLGDSAEQAVGFRMFLDEFSCLRERLSCEARA